MHLLPPSLYLFRSLCLQRLQLWSKVVSAGILFFLYVIISIPLRTQHIHTYIYQTQTLAEGGDRDTEEGRLEDGRKKERQGIDYILTILTPRMLPSWDEAKENEKGRKVELSDQVDVFFSSFLLLFFPLASIRFYLYNKLLMHCRRPKTLDITPAHVLINSTCILGFRGEKRFSGYKTE